MDNKPVRNPNAHRFLSIAIANLSLASIEFETREQGEQLKAADVLLDSAANLLKQVTK